MAKRNMISEKILEAACDALTIWEDGATLDDCLDALDELDKKEGYNGRAIKPAVSSLLFEYFRHKGFVDNLIRKFAKKGDVHKEVRIILQCAITQALYQTGIAAESAVNVAVDYTKNKYGRGRSSFINALLRAVLRAPDKDKGEESSFPGILYKKYLADHGVEKTKEIISHFASNPPLTFRMREELPKEELEKYGAEAVPSFLETDLPFPFFEFSSVKEFFADRMQESGKVYVQDPATSLSISLAKNAFKEGMICGKVLDCCAAPGGKTLMLADLTADKGAKIIASDRSKQRCTLMNVNFKRAGIRSSVKHLSAQENYFPAESFDLILADVPCSNTGVIRRRPDAPWKFSMKRVQELVSLQKEILSSLAPLVKKDGFLLYSTCSIEKEEDMEQVKTFLAEHKDFSLVSEKLLFPARYHDGAYAALLKKIP